LSVTIRVTYACVSATHAFARPEILNAVVEIVFISEDFFTFLAGNFKLICKQNFSLTIPPKYD
jgi:hypothetical protein